MIAILLVVGTVFVIYGIIVQLAKSGSRFFLFFYGMGALLFGIGISRITGTYMRIPSGIRYCFHGFAGICVILFVVTQILILDMFHSEGKPGLDYVIVLGALVRKTGPSNVLRDRLDTAILYLNANSSTKCVVAGGRGFNEHVEEAKMMREYLLEKGIAEERIISEDRSLNTHENICNTAKLVGKDCSVGIVTSNFHVYRGVRLAKKAGFREVSGIAAHSHRLYLMCNLMRESIGIVKDKICGNL